MRQRTIQQLNRIRVRWYQPDNYPYKKKVHFMKQKIWFSTVLLLLLSACAPFVISQSTGEQPTPVIETVPAVPDQGYQAVAVDGVEVEVGVGSPIPVHVIVSGSLPGTCAQIEHVQQQQDGSTFRVSVSAVPSVAEDCIQDTLPFKIGIPLNVVNLPAGSYAVEVNGVSTTFNLDTGSTGSELPTTNSPITKDDIQVDTVDIDIGVGSPIQVHAIVSGNLPGTCAQVGEIRMHRDGTTFLVRLIAATPEIGSCTPDSLPFRLEIPLNIVNLPEGPYEVNVNGTTASFDPRAVPSDATEMEDYESRLQAALIQRDEQEMQALMSESFLIALWQSEGVLYPAQEAVTQLLTNYVGSDSAIAFQVFQDMPGFDPRTMVGPDVDLVKTIFVTGWGLDGKDEALLLVARRPDGSLYWHSVLVAPEGFSPPNG